MTAANIRNLLPVRETDRLEHERRAREALTAWGLAWLPTQAWTPRIETACSTEQALREDTGAWTAHGRAGAASAQAWSAAADDVPQRLASLMTGREGTMALPESDWAVQAAVAALRDLHARLLGPVMAAGGAPDLRRLSGAVMVCERTLGLAWVWARAEASTSSSPVAAKPLAPVTQGMSSQRVRLSAGLGEVEIEVADLLGLQIGDVIRFPAALKGAVSVAIGEPEHAQPAFDAQLGQADGHVAIKLQSKCPAA